MANDRLISQQALLRHASCETKPVSIFRLQDEMDILSRIAAIPSGATKNQALDFTDSGLNLSVYANLPLPR